MALRNKFVSTYTSEAEDFAHPCACVIYMYKCLLQTVCELQLAHSSERCEAGSRLCGKWASIIFMLAISGFHFQLSSSGPCDTSTLWAIVEIYFSQHPSFATAPFSRQRFWTGLSKTSRALHIYPLSYGVPVRERYGSTLLPGTREQHDQNCTQSH